MIAGVDSVVFGDLFCGDDRIAAEFDDRRRIADLLDVEVALARAQARTGLMPSAAAEAIASAAAALEVDIPALRFSVAASAVPTIELVRQLRHAVGPDLAAFVHRGATSQDIVDTAAVLALKRANALIEGRLREIVDSFVALAERHRDVVLAGRTHGQQASPTTFGLKVANWLAPLPRHWQRLAELEPRLFVVQFGGAAGTLGALGERGSAVLDALARELGLGAAVPWHTQRDGIVEYGNWLAMLAGSLAKFGQDVILLGQTEVAEVSESSDGARGGSSTMPHKANPIGSEMVIVAARATAALLSALHAAAIQEHERATHGWQLEWFVLPQMVALTYGAATHAARVARALDVDAVRMRENISRAGDVVLAESLSVALAGQLGVDAAQALVKRAASDARASRDSLVAAVRRAATAAGVEQGIDWDRAADPAAQLGAAHAFIDRVVNDARRIVR